MGSKPGTRPSRRGPSEADGKGTLARAGRDRDRPLLHERSRTAPRRATPVGTTPVPLRPGRQGILGTVNVVPLAEVAEELGGTGAVDARAASATIAEIVRFPSGS